MIRKPSTGHQSILEQSRHDRSQYSTFKPSNLDHSGLLTDKSNKRNQQYQAISTNKQKQNTLCQTPVQPYKDNSKSKAFITPDSDQNRYMIWTPNAFKISSPKSTPYTGNNTQRENRNKVQPFTEQIALPPRPHNYQRSNFANNPDYRKVNSGHRKNVQAIKQKKEPYKPLSYESNGKKDKFFEYVLKYSYRSKKGYTPNTVKTNQDAYVINTSIGKKSWQHYFGICDGHGSLGHHVSSFIKTNLSKAIDNVDGVDKSKIREVLFQSFKSTNEKLCQESGIDLAYSGSTVVGCYLNHDKLYCCNVGDSRAIIGYKRHNKWGAKQLSIDHKPSEKTEAQRILKKGRIQQCKDSDGNYVGPERVWLKDQNIPGLAMTRSFGDLVAASVGVSWEPEITQFTLSSEDKIIIIASDGVWEFLENEDIVTKLAPFYEKNEIEQACDFLLDYANSSWTSNSPAIDDISFVMIFMGYTS